MTAADRLVVRVDAGADAGFGHAMRCIALAQGWRDARGEVTFVHAEMPSAVERRLADEGFESVPLQVKPGGEGDADGTAALARERRAAWTVLDGYRFDGGFQKRLKAAGLRVLALDDFGHAGAYTADLVLNQNAGADGSLYPNLAPGTQLLLGSRYVLLRRAFLALRKEGREIPDRAGNVLVTFGGVDAQDVSSKVLRALQRLETDGFRVRLVIGPGNTHAAELETLASACVPPVRVGRDPADLPHWMDEADLAVAGAGTSSWELAYLGIPMILVATADNQRGVAGRLAQAGVALSLGWHADATEARIAQSILALAADANRRRDMARRGQALVDGHGVSRVVTIMKSALVTLRPVGADDARILWEWANEATVRSASFSTKSIPWDDHVKWLAARLADRATAFYIALSAEGEPLGQIRFDVAGEEAEVSVSIDAKHRGHGYGSAVVLAGSRKLFATSRVRTIHAYVKEGNAASVAAFLKAGYAPNGRATVRGHDALRFTLAREALP